MSNVFSEDHLRKIAAQKVDFKYSVKINAFAFCVVMFLLFVINFFTGIAYLWFLYPLLGWQIGLVVHTIVYVLYARGVYPMSRRATYIHGFSYLSVMLLLFMVDFNIMDIATATHAIDWVLYPAIFWGLGLGIHIFVYHFYLRSKLTKDGETISKKQRKIEEELEKMRKKMNTES